MQPDDILTTLDGRRPLIEDDLENEDDLKHEDDLKNEDDLKMKMKLPEICFMTSPHDSQTTTDVKPQMIPGV